MKKIICDICGQLIQNENSFILPIFNYEDFEIKKNLNGPILCKTSIIKNKRVECDLCDNCENEIASYISKIKRI